MYTDFEEALTSPVLSTATSSGLGWSPLGMEDGGQKEKSLHPLDLRPWDITVLINLYKVHGRLPIVSSMPFCVHISYFQSKIEKNAQKNVFKSSHIIIQFFIFTNVFCIFLFIFLTLNNFFVLDFNQFLKLLSQKLMKYNL